MMLFLLYALLLLVVEADHVEAKMNPFSFFGKTHLNDDDAVPTSHSTNTRRE
jgi:hypothetical protein